jgi:lipid II:glycine glycyltransferase (peptidoglycan interpeptide bridge formation enzyme)
MYSTQLCVIQLSVMEEKINKIAIHPLQSWQWGEFRKDWGNEVVRFSSGQVIFSKVPLFGLTIGTFIKGPKPTKTMLEELKKIGKEKNSIFIKLEPNVVSDDTSLLKKYCVPGKRLFTPETFIIDLTKSEEELLKSFSSKTRYNIRLAQKHGVTIEENNSEEAFKKYLELTFATAKRQGFYAHTKKYHQLMWQYLKGNIAHLLTAKYKGKILTAWILFVWKDTLYYPYGASSQEHKEVMANNLIMWEAIRFGKKLGLKKFDLWGKEEGKGFTRFKEGYNPEVVRFLGTWDLVINPFLYWLYRIAEYLRWLLLRLKSKIFS